VKSRLTIAVEEGQPVFEHGLTLRSFLGILYAAMVLQPAVIWIYFSTGQSPIVLATYASVFLFGEVAALFGKPLRKQEVFIFLVGCSSATSLFFPLLIYNLYFRRHPQIYNIKDMFPGWWAPSSDSPVWPLRTFIHPDWLAPILVSFVPIIGGIATNISLAFIMREIYIRQEKLPFPIYQVQADLCSTLSEREESRSRIFLASAVISFAYGLVLYALPQISYAILDVSIRVIPLPWVDLNYLSEVALPGASFGIATDPTIVLIGFLINPVVTLSIFVGAMAVYFFGNWVLVSQGLFTEWHPGMSLQLAWQRSILRFWASPNIMLVVAAGLLPLVFGYKILIRSFKSLAKIRASRTRLSLNILLVLYFAGTLSSVAVAYLLVPDFPVWVLLMLSAGWTFMLNLFSARSVGTTGIPINIPYVREGAILTSGYQKYDVWFAPIVFPAFPALAPSLEPEGANWCGFLKVADLTSTHPMDLVKSILIAIPLGIIFSFIYTQMFWNIAQIPSALFPTPFWDINVTMTTLFITRQISFFRPDWMAATLVLAVAIQCLTEFMHVPISLIGISVGAASPIANSIGILIGFLIGKLLGRFFGKEWFAKNKATIVVGALTGEGLAVAFSAGVAMIFESLWVRPI